MEGIHYYTLYMYLIHHAPKMKPLIVNIYPLRFFVCNETQLVKGYHRSLPQDAIGRLSIWCGFESLTAYMIYSF